MRDLFRLDGIEYIWTREGCLIPSIASPFASPYLYRGQVARYQPCLPSVFRGLTACGRRAWHPDWLTVREKLGLIAHRARLEEFVRVIADHPASAYAREIGLKLHPVPLAQHYEMATDRIDLTQDHMVAAFFATNSYSNGCWAPVKDGVGVMYRLLSRPFSRTFPDHMICIGKQTFPRPGEQKAYAFTIPLGRDLERFPIEIYTFRHSESCGKKINCRFNGGSSLFPKDVMSEVSDLIRSDESISREILCWLMENDGPCRDLFSLSFDELERLAALHDLKISGRSPVALTFSQRKDANNAVSEMRDGFLKNVGALAVRRVKK